MVYGSTVRTIPALVVVLGGLAYLIGTHVEGESPYAWALLLFALYVYRMLIARRALAAKMPPERLIAHSSVMSLFTASLGALAGGGLLYFFGRLPGESQALVTMICIGWIAGAVGVSGLYPRYIIPWFAAFGGSMVLCWLIYGHSNRFLVAVMLAFLVVYLSITVTEIGKTTARSIEIGFQNVNLNAQLKATLDTKSRFMNAASHDLRQPLHAIDLLRANLMSAADAGDAMRLARRLIRPIRALGSILDSLVLIARLEKPLEPTPVRFALSDLRDEMADEFQPYAEASDVMLSVRADAMDVECDRHLLTRCLRNLIDNAFKFTAVGSIRVDLRCPDRAALEVTVADTGQGIARDELERIFDAFYQAPGAGRARMHGVGLGLDIVDKLVTLMKGKISANSELGLGSTFRIQLPAPNAPSPPAAPAPPFEHADAGAIGTGLVLLFVEDDPTLQDEWFEWCSKQGHRSLFAGSVQEARALAANLPSPPDAIVADYHLPDGTGIEVIDLCKRAWPEVSMVLLTGDADPSIVEAAKAANATLLRKPADPHRVVNEIMALRESSHTNRTIE